MEKPVHETQDAKSAGNITKNRNIGRAIVENARDAINVNIRLNQTPVDKPFNKENIVIIGIS